MDIADLQKLCGDGAIRWTAHVLKRLLQRGISQADVLRAIQGGEIIEQYPDDYPYPSCLLLGADTAGDPLHLRCRRGPGEMWMITANHPDPDEWDADLKTRTKVQK